MSDDLQDLIVRLALGIAMVLVAFGVMCLGMKFMFEYVG